MLLGRARVVDSAPREEADLLRCLVELRWLSTKPIASAINIWTDIHFQTLESQFPPFPFLLCLRVSLKLHLSIVINGLPVFLTLDPTPSVLPVESKER